MGMRLIMGHGIEVYHGTWEGGKLWDIE